MFQYLPPSIIDKINLWNSTPFADDIKNIVKEWKRRENIHIQYTSLIEYIQFLSKFNKQLCDKYNIIYKPPKLYFPNIFQSITINIGNICVCTNYFYDMEFYGMPIPIGPSFEVYRKRVPKVPIIKTYNKSRFTKKEIIYRNNIRKNQNQHKRLNMF